MQACQRAERDESLSVCARVTRSLKRRKKKKNTSTSYAQEKSLAEKNTNLYWVEKGPELSLFVSYNPNFHSSPQTDFRDGTRRWPSPTTRISQVP